MSGKVVVASANPGKIRELSALFAPLDLEVTSQGDYGVQPADETAVTFIENALLKARHACRATGLPAVADDSGIVVDSLDGAPGVYSARYAGESASDANNLAKLLTELEGRREEERWAHYECVLAYMLTPLDPSPVVCRGTWSGRVLTSPRGEGGFGYDPVFYIPELGRTVAELTLETKNSLSHRGQAMRQLAHRLRPR